ncbi:branched-chain amino acid ABC transporter permease [Bordetella genomosp. 1]|uniref:Branched-chain amino acid ABC transporter permease n=1 Tax=Bordetella genomosp. 1 TaxID=1395607 RepID=A0A261S734_9BORD|nr:branched-chain amino acid ABC transporter permease [Bordetella genomosp. 1]OZI33194.1 branched-chain amino acid ABC transporter permease [Bordetella genomosp. 1]
MKQRLSFIAALAAIAFLPGFFGSSDSLNGTLVTIAIFAVMAYGLDMVVSDLGEVSLAHTVFFAAGAYATGYLSTSFGAGPLTTLAAGIAISISLAALVGWATLHLREFVFSLVTYAMAIVALTVAQNWTLLGGSDGLRGIPPLQVSLGEWSWSASGDRDLWPIAFGLLALTLYVITKFRASSLGKAALMSHQNPRLALMSGIRPERVRMQVFILSAPITASAGWLYAYQRAYVSADVLDTYFLILMLTAVILFGRRQLLGPLIAIGLILTQERVFSLGAYYDKILLGAVIVITLAFFPGGILSAFSKLFARRSPAPKRSLT